MNSNKTHYDVIVIGGGINGAGIALDASLRGFSVLLVDKNDFGSATTSASTKLIHGGLRYLEYYEFSLVRESLRERERLLKNAPHLVRPLMLKIPIYKESRRNTWFIQAGMILYDLLSFDKSLPNHKLIRKGRKGRLEQIAPGLNQTNLKSMVFYYDCQVNFPERLCLEILLSAKKTGAEILNYHEVLKIANTPDLNSLTIRDRFSDKIFQVSGKVVVNAGGAFVDQVLELTGDKIDQKIHGTKGSHIIIPKFKDGPQNALYVEAIQDGRPFFIIPWRSYYLVGTTDIYFDGNLNDIAINKEEIRYLLFEINHFFPKAAITTENILYSYSGIRPLPYEPGKKEGQVTRKHIVYDHEKHDGHHNFISIIGGKITTYRNLAEDCVDLICKKLNRSGIKSPTKGYKLFGATGISDIDDYKNKSAAEFAHQVGLNKETVDYLIDFYGSKFKNILEIISANPELKEPICQHNPDISAQIIYAINFEEAKTLEDILIRRTGIGSSACLGLNCVEKTAELAAPLLHWTETEKKQATENYKAYIKKRYLPDPLSYKCDNNF